MCSSDLWGKRSDVPERVRTSAPWLAAAPERKFWFDEAYDAVFAWPVRMLASALGRFVERPLFLDPLGGLGTGMRGLSGRLGAVQTGGVRTYVLMLALGLAVLTVVFLAVS